MFIISYILDFLGLLEDSTYQPPYLWILAFKIFSVRSQALFLKLILGNDRSIIDEAT